MAPCVIESSSLLIPHYTYTKRWQQFKMNQIFITILIFLLSLQSVFGQNRNIEDFMVIVAEGLLEDESIRTHTSEYKGESFVFFYLNSENTRSDFKCEGQSNNIKYKIWSIERLFFHCVDDFIEVSSINIKNNKLIANYQIRVELEPKYYGVIKLAKNGEEWKVLKVTIKKIKQ